VQKVELLLSSANFSHRVLGRRRGTQDRKNGPWSAVHAAKSSVLARRGNSHVWTLEGGEYIHPYTATPHSPETMYGRRRFNRISIFEDASDIMHTL